MSQNPFLGLSKSHFLTLFVENFCFKWPYNGEINLEICPGYEKHSSSSGQYVSKKIRVIRRVELKILQEINEKVEKELKNKGSLHRTVS